ncbi:MAG: hypothetical protein IJZ36_02940 [Bacilli bacterium]|nr:hypothetical protein [Bacilli bacterium]
MKIVKINAMWCSGCLSMKKIWKSIEEEYELEIVNYDYDMDDDVVENYNVGDILPVAIFYKDDIEVARLVGEHKKEDIIKIIEENI